MALIINKETNEDNIQEIKLPDDYKDEHNPIELNFKDRTFSPFDGYVVAVVNDCNSQKITFHVPAEYDGVDLYGTKCSLIWETSWTDDNGKISKGIIEDLIPTYYKRQKIKDENGNIVYEKIEVSWDSTIAEPGDYIEYVWYLNKYQTAKAGKCSFLLMFTLDPDEGTKPEKQEGEDDSDYNKRLTRWELEEGYSLSSMAGKFTVKNPGIDSSLNEGETLVIDGLSYDEIKESMDKIEGIRDGLYEINNKLSKVETSDSWTRVYAIDEKGNQIIIPLTTKSDYETDNPNNLSSIPRRLSAKDGQAGQINVPYMPVAESNATSKQYVDKKIELNQEKISDSIVKISNISFFEHELDIMVKADGINLEDIVITRTGKNLLQFDDFIDAGSARTNRMENGVFNVSCETKFSASTVLKPEYFTNYYSGVQNFPIGTYIFSAELFKSHKPYLKIALEDGTEDKIIAGEAKIVNQSFSIISILIDAQVTFDVGETYISKFQLEYNSVASSYEDPDIVTKTADETGMVYGLTSKYPVTYLIANSDKVSIRCRYNIDGNELMRQIGNINKILSYIVNGTIEEEDTDWPNWPDQPDVPPDEPPIDPNPPEEPVQPNTEISSDGVFVVTDNKNTSATINQNNVLTIESEYYKAEITNDQLVVSKK